MSGDARTLTGFISGDRYRSSEELERRATQAATVLDAAGVGCGDAVAIMMRNDLPFLEASYAAQALGALAVPVNWHFKRDEVAFILRDCAARALIVHADLLDQIAGAVPDGVAVFVVATPPEVAAAYGIDAVAPSENQCSWDAAVDAAEPWRCAPRPAPPSMIYTSGTTGAPKGVRFLSHRDPAHPGVQAALEAIGLAAGMRTVVCGPMYQSAPNVFALHAGRTGGLVVLQPKFDAAGLLELIERHAITSLHLVPTMMVRLLRLDPETRARHDLSSLRTVAHAAAPCPVEVKRAMIEWWGPIIGKYYGATETGPIVACDSSQWLSHPGTVGRPLPGCEVRVAGESGDWVGPGEAGDVYLINRGWGDFTYNGQDGARRELERDGLLTAGDIGFVDGDGFLYLCDRRKDMIISGGVNVYPAEIEAVLIEHGDVKDCAVFGLPDPEFGESIAAVIQPHADALLSGDEVREYLRERLASYKVPRRIEFADELPREDSGKIFKRKLRERYAAAGATQEVGV